MVVPVVERISARRLKEFVEAGGDVLVVDLRDRDAFEGAHVPGAVRMAPEDAVSNASDLARREAVVVYDGDPQSVFSTRTAQELRDRGVPRAMDFEGGVEEWVARGYDVETGVEAEASGGRGRGPGSSRAM